MLISRRGEPACTVCQRRRKQCSYDDALFARDAAVRRSFRKVVEFVRKSVENGTNAHLSAPGVRERAGGTGKFKKYPVFTPAFHRLAGRFERARTRAESRSLVSSPAVAPSAVVPSAVALASVVTPPRRRGDGRDEFLYSAVSSMFQTQADIAQSLRVGLPLLPLTDLR